MRNICTECAKGMGWKWPKDAPVTESEGLCAECEKVLGCSTEDKWEKPE